MDYIYLLHIVFCVYSVLWFLVVGNGNDSFRKAISMHNGLNNTYYRCHNIFVQYIQVSCFCKVLIFG